MLRARLWGTRSLFGRQLRTISIFALGVTLTSRFIILQLMTVVSPQLKKLQEEARWAAKD